MADKSKIVDLLLKSVNECDSQYDKSWVSLVVDIANAAPEDEINLSELSARLLNTIASELDNDRND